MIDWRVFGKFPASKKFDEKNSLRLVQCFFGIIDECSDIELDLMCYKRCICRDSIPVGTRMEYDVFVEKIVVVIQRMKKIMTLDNMVIARLYLMR